MSSRQYRKCGAFRSTVVATSSPRLTARLKRSARVSFLGNRMVLCATWISWRRSPTSSSESARSRMVKFSPNPIGPRGRGATEHLLRGSSREGEEEDGGWGHAGFHEPCDPVDEGAGFSRSGPRDDEQGAVPVEDRLPLPRGGHAR